MEKFDSLFGSRLNELMVVQGKTSADVAAAIGVHVTTVRRWQRNSKCIKLCSLLNLADYFQCSLDFLAGRSEKELDYTPHPCPPFYQRLREVMEEKHVTRYKMAKKSKIKDSYFTTWSKGADPQLHSLVEAAKYLHVSIDYLVGRDR